MTVVRVEPVVKVKSVIVLYLVHTCGLEQVVAMVHQCAERVERAHHLLHVGDDGLVVVLGQTGHEVLGYLVVGGKLHLLGVYQHKLQFIGVLLVEQ